MNKICFFLAPYPRVKNWFDMVDVAAEYGHTGLEGFNVMELATPDREFARKLRAYADSKGVRFCCFSAGVNLVGEDSRKNIQKLKDGDPLGGRSNAADEFESVEDDDFLA